jgi:hypothetical protein
MQLRPATFAAPPRRKRRNGWERPATTRQLWAEQGTGCLVPEAVLQWRWTASLGRWRRARGGCRRGGGETTLGRGGGEGAAWSRGDAGGAARSWAAEELRCGSGGGGVS